MPPAVAALPLIPRKSGADILPLSFGVTIRRRSFTHAIFGIAQVLEL